MFSSRDSFEAAERDYSSRFKVQDASLAHHLTKGLIQRNQAIRDPSLAHHLTKGLIQRNQAIRGITILHSAISRIQIHPALYKFKAKCMKPALQVLDSDITEISKEGGHFDSTHFLCYYYYGGMIYTALKNWDRAGYFFEVAITTPSMAVSHIMLEAYKKFILVCLIQHGKVPNLPKYTSQVVNRFIKVGI
nr:COP9 signalosome complex subunit 3-like [Lytechinus pictus]